MAIARASESDEVLRQSFCFLSLCSNDSFPIEALVNFVKIRTTGQAEELIKAKILTCSLMTCLHSEGRESCYLRVHNIVDKVLKTILMPDLDFKDRVQCVSAAIKTFHSIIEAERQLLGSSGHACAKLRKIYAHCRALYEIITTDTAVKDVLVKEIAQSVTTGNAVSWLCSTAHVCCYLAYLKDANIFSKAAADFVKYTTGTRKDELLHANVFFTSGKVLELQCEYQEAISRYENAMTIYVEIYGEEHAETAKSNSALGNVYFRLGQYSQAKKYREKAMIIRKRIYGEEHLDIVSNYVYLRYDYS